VGLGAAVLVVTALLVNAPPPGGAASRLEGATGVTIENAQVSLDVTATPGAAGLNDLHVNTYSPSGTPLDVDAVEMTIELPGRAIAPLVVPLRELGPGHYFSPGLDIPLAGDWLVRATIRLGPVDRVDVAGTLEVR
jgi:copper transport protein